MDLSNHPIKLLVESSIDLSSKISFNFWFDILSKLHPREILEFYSINSTFRHLVLELAQSGGLKVSRGYAFGNNKYNKLGISRDGNKGEDRWDLETTPKLMILENITQIASGDGESLILTEQDGKTELNIVSETWYQNDQLIKLHYVTIFKDTGKRQSIPIENIGRIIQISAGVAHFLILTEHGQVFVYGTNRNGQLGKRSIIFTRIPQLILNLPKIKQISTGQLYSIIVSKNNEVFTFGYNEFGQLGLGDDNERRTPERVTFYSNGKIIFPIIKEISGGSDHSLILTENNKIYGFGNNYFGQLGAETDNVGSSVPILIDTTMITDKIKSIQTGNGYSLILTENGEVYSFGNNLEGQLGLENIIECGIPTLIPNIVDASQISTSSHHSLILTKNGNVYSFGSNNFGQLGLGNFIFKSTPTLIPNINNAILIFSDSRSSFIIVRKNIYEHI